MRSYARRLVSAVLLLPFILSMLGASQIVSAGGTSFRFSTEFSTSKQGPIWKYQYCTTDNDDYQDLPNDGGTWWKPDWSIGKISNNEIVAGQGKIDVAIVFTAPEDGAVTLKAADKIHFLKAKDVNAYTDGCRIKIKINKNQVWPKSGWQAIDQNKEFNDFPEQKVTLKKGDNIFFIINNGPNGSNGDDNITWDPVVAYEKEVKVALVDSVTPTDSSAPAAASNTEIENAIATFKASEGFSGIQGKNNWYYQYGPTGSPSYQAYPTFAENGWWQEPNNWIIGKIWSNGITPGMGKWEFATDAVRTFVAPVSGTVVISALDNKISVVKECQDMARLKIQKNEKQIWPSSNWTVLTASNNVTAFTPIKVDVSKGDSLCFVADNGGNGNNGQCDITWDPIISYVSADEDISSDSSGVTGVTLDKNELALITGDIAQLTAAVEPENAVSKDIIWVSDNPDVASVDNGVVTAKLAGTAIISAISKIGGVTAKATVTVEKVPFVDTVNHWAKDDIEYVASKGIITGKDAQHFDPDTNITRAEFLALVIRALKIDQPIYKNRIKDVKASYWYSAALQAALDNNIIDEGMLPDKRFSPETNITREEMTSLIVNSHDFTLEVATEPTTLEQFADSGKITGWALKYVEKAKNLGIINGTTPQTFEPLSNATRAEAAVIIKRLLEKIAPVDIEKLINDAAASGQTNVKIPARTYRLAPKNNGMVVITIKGAKNLEIDATDVKLVCTKLTRAINIEDCENVTLKGLTVDYDPLPFTQGRVIAIAPDETYFDMKIDDGYPKELFERVTILDKDTNFQKKFINHLWGTKVEWKEKGSVIRIYTKGAEIGDPITLAGGPVNGIPHGLTIGDSSNVVIKDVTIHTCPGMGIIESGGSKDGGNKFYGVKIVPGSPPKGATQAPLLTALWDATQSQVSRVGPVWEDCQIINAGDDTWSIGGIELITLKKEGNVLYTNTTSSLRAGDKLKRWHDGQEATVVSVENVTKDVAKLSQETIDAIKNAKQYTVYYGRMGNDMVSKITLDKDVPEEFVEGTTLFSPNLVGEGFVFKNNYIKSPGRGCFVKGATSDGLIEGNTFEGGDKAIMITPELVGDSAAGCSGNLIIRGNTLKETGYHHEMSWSEQAGSLCLSAGNATTKHPFYNILIEGNKFEDIRDLNMNLSDCQGVVVRNNTFSNTHSVPVGQNGITKGVDCKTVIWVARSSGITFENNVIDKIGKYGDKAIKIDASASDIKGADTGVKVESK